MLPSVPGYLVERSLGEYHPATLWSGREVSTGRRVALRVLALAAGPQRSAAQSAAEDWSRISDPHLLRVHDVIESREALVVVLDLLDGGSLGDVLRVHGVLPPGQVVTALAPLARALAAVHRAGMVHGNLVASAVRFDRTGRPILTEPAPLGAALTDPAVGAAASPEAAPGPAAPGPATPGSSAMGPAVSEQAAAAGDVAALAALALQALTGSPREAAQSAAKGAAAVRPALEPSQTPGALEPVPTAAASLVRARWPALAALSDALDLVCLALHPEPARRPDAERLATALFALAAPEPVRLAGRALPDALEAGGRRRTFARRRASGRQPTAAGSRSRRGLGGRRARATVAIAVAASAVVAAAASAMVLVGGPTPLARPLAGGLDPGTWCSGHLPEPARSVVPAPGDWTSVVVALEHARARAFEEDDPAALCLVYAPTSAGLAADLALMSTHRDHGLVPAGVRFRVESVRLVSTSPGAVDVSVIDSLPSYDLLDRSGRVRQRQAGLLREEWTARLVPSADKAGWVLK